SSLPPAARRSFRSAGVGENLIPRSRISSATCATGTPPRRREIISSLSNARGLAGGGLGVKWATTWKRELAWAGLVATMSKGLSPGLRVMGSDQYSAAFSVLGRSAAGAPLMVIVGRPLLSMATPRMMSGDSLTSTVWFWFTPDGAMTTSVGGDGGEPGWGSGVAVG